LATVFVLETTFCQTLFAMKKLLLYLLLAVFTFSSCKDEETPQTFLNATYEMSHEYSDTGIWYASQYIFQSNGTYEQLYLLRASKAGDVIGYLSHSKGAYSLRGEDLSVRATEYSSVNHETFPEGYVTRLADLEAQSMSADFIESKGTLKRLDGGKKISILFECNDMIGLAMCTGELVYDRIE
jgi:hypothetical protein